MVQMYESGFRDLGRRKIKLQHGEKIPIHDLLSGGRDATLAGVPLIAKYF